jgi:hypothetical protein
MSGLRGQDLWRQAPIFKYGFADAVPGFREGLVLFALFCAYEAATARMGGGGAHDHPPAAHHAPGHEDAHAAAHAPHGAAAHGGAHGAEKLH